MKPWKRYAGRLAWPTIALASLLLAATATIWWAVLAAGLPLWAGLAAMVVVDYLWFTPLHEAAHRNVGGGRPGLGALDTAVGWIASAAFVAPFPAFRLLHLRHHGEVNHEGRDPDLWVAAPTAPGVIGRCLTILPYYYVVLFRQLRHESPAKRRAAGQAAAVLALFALAGGLAAAGGLGGELLALWVVPGWLATALLAFLFDYLPHHPHHDSGRWTNARVFVGGRLLTTLMVGQNYHLVHHLYPRVPFYRYGDLFRDLRPELEAHGSPVVERR